MAAPPALRAPFPVPHFPCPERHAPTHSAETRMNPAAIVTLLVIGGFVWGGLVVILTKAVRKEREKGAGE